MTHSRTRRPRALINTLLAFTSLAFLALATGCPPPSQQRDHRKNAPRQGGGGFDAQACGNYQAEADVGRKLYAFLTATARLDTAVRTTEDELRNTCAVMAGELGISSTGPTQVLCTEVAETIRKNLSTGMAVNSRLDVQYQPAVCTVDVNVAAQAAAQCQAQAQADVQVTCEGTCNGTCNGRCDGTCAGAAGGGGAAGECNGECTGTCHGTCQGGCDGYADVQADASCEAQAEIEANVQAQCTEPEVKVQAQTEVVVDQAKIDATMRALERGLPRILMIQARMSGPVFRAFKTWSRASVELVKSGPQLVQALGSRGACVLGQLVAAGAMLGRIEASVSVQIEVSAEVSASAGGGTR